MESKDEYIKILESQVRVQKAIVAKLKKKYNHVDNIIEDPTGQIYDIVSNETPIQSPDADNTERGEIDPNEPQTKEWIEYFTIKANYLAENVGSGELWNRTEFRNKIIDVLTDVADKVQSDSNPTPPTLLNELRENADTDSAILDALSTILQVGASMATNGISDEISEWDLPKTTPIKAKRKIVKEAEKWNDVNRKRAIELKNAYDVLSRSYHNRPL